MPLRRPWAAVCEALAREGVEYVFGLPGNPELLYNDLFEYPQITPVLVRHETSAVFMAMAYARATYDEERWVEMMIVPRDAVIRLWAPGESES